MRPPTKSYVRELQVGLFVFTACLVIAAFSFRITETPIFQRGTTLVTYLDDATGIFKKSKVKMAGIDIGFIEAITLENGKAKISILIKKGIQIPKGAQIMPRPLGILGDKYLEVTLPKAPSAGSGGSDAVEVPSSDSSPSPSSWFTLITPVYAEDGNPTGVTSKSPVFKEGEVIKSSNSPTTLDDLTRQMGSVSQDLKAISGTLRQLVEGNTKVNSPVGRTLKNFEDLSHNMNEIVTENRTDLHKLISSLSHSSQKLEEVFTSVKEGDLRKDIQNLSKAVGNVSNSLAHVDSILSKVDGGEGTLGKLVNDSTTIDELNSTLASVNDLVNRAQRTQIIVESTGEYNFKPKSSKLYAGLRIMPREDFGYLAQIVIDPEGKTTHTVTRTVTDAGVPTTKDELVTEKNTFKISAQLYKRVWDFSFRVGVFESTGGAGVDYYFLHDTLQLGLEAFDFSRATDNLHLKIYGRYTFLRYVYLTVGGDDIVSHQSGTRSLYAGLGLRFTDDDIKAVLLLPGLH